MRVVTYNTKRRDKNRRPEIKVRLIATDNYGDMALAECRYTGEIFDPMNGVVRGAILPQAKVAYLDGPDSETANAESIENFKEMDSNCNTCLHLIRLPISKKENISGLHPGKCASVPDKSHPYPPDLNGIMHFAPEDFQGMPCWRART